MQSGIIGKMEQYIEQTGLSRFIRSRYQMNGHEFREVSVLGMNNPSGAVSLAYTYGLAKGYRAAKAEERHGKTD